MKNTTINFMYWLHNHKNIEQALLDCFGSHLGKHFYSKLEDGLVNSMIKLFMNMSEDNQEKLIEWADKNYSYKGGK